MMSRALQESSLHVYESHWARVVSFCRSKRWHMFRVRSHHFSTYMIHLFRDGLLPSTIISHRMSVASVLRHWVYDPAANPHIKLLRAFWLECPMQRRIMPKWDLHLVLMVLMSPPFASEVSDQAETSNDVIPLKWRTMKADSVPVSIGFGETTFLPSCFEFHSRQVCVFERKHPASTDSISVTGNRFSCQEPATVAGFAMDLRAGYCTSQPIWSGTDALPCEAIEALSTGGWGVGGDSGCSFIGITPSETSWEVISANGSWRLSRRLTHELIGSTTKLQHMRSEPCQPHGLTLTVRWCSGGRREYSRIPIYVTWPVSLMGCQLWVQWWWHKSWIQDISHLLILHDLYAATDMVIERIYLKLMLLSSSNQKYPPFPLFSYFSGLCAWDVCYIIFCHLLYIYYQKTREFVFIYKYCAVYDECKLSDTFWLAYRIRLFVHYTISLSSLCKLYLKTLNLYWNACQI